MGARQSRRSVDITTTPKKEGIAAEGGDAAAPGDGKLERIEETDAKPTTNGVAPHTDTAEDKDKDKDDATEKEKDKPEDVKTEETKQEVAGVSPAETTEVATPTETTPASPNTVTSPDSKETKKKEKMKKKWSFRSISFSKKDKNKPAREEAPKNGDVTKEEPLAEGGEEAENGSAATVSPVEEKSAASSPTAESETAPVAEPAATATTAAPATESQEDSAAPVASSPAVEKTEEPAPSAPTPVPVEEKKEEPEKVQAESKVVEVSPAGGQFVPDPVEVSVSHVQTVATPSIVERKTTEDVPTPLPPSSPPPTPVDSSPSQRAQQAAETATALAMALSLPAEAADNDSPTLPVLTSSSSQEPNDPPLPAAEVSTVELPRAETTSVPPCVEPSAAMHAESLGSPVVLAAQNLVSLSAGDGNDVEAAAASGPVPFYGPYMPQEAVTLSENSAEGDPATRREAGAEEKIAVPSSVARQPANEIEEPSAAASAVPGPCAAPTIEGPENAGSPEPPAAKEEVEPEVAVPGAEVDADRSTIDRIVESEEGPMPVSDESLVKAEPAVVVPEDEEPTDAVPPTEEVLVSGTLEEANDRPVRDESSVDQEPVADAVAAAEPRGTETEEEPTPSALPESHVPTAPPKRLDPESVHANVVEEAIAVPCPVADAEPRLLDAESRSDADGSPLSCSVAENELPSRIAASPEAENDSESTANDLPVGVGLPVQPDHASDCSPPPPEALHVSLDEAMDELPAPDVQPPSGQRNPTETLPSPPRSPSPRSDISITSGLTTSTKDSSQTQLRDDQSNREFKMESVSISLDSYNESDVELKERLAESLAVTEKQEENSVSRQLSNNATSSTTVQETHQTTPEADAPLENNVAHDSTTESFDETSKVTPPVVPSETPVSPPSAPAITEDVASVAKAIEELDISDKAVAAATIECNTNEIIADAHYQNNVNE